MSGSKAKGIHRKDAEDAEKSSIKSIHHEGHEGLEEKQSCQKRKAFTTEHTRTGKTRRKAKQ